MGVSASSVRWFKEARLGIFIHWGIYSILGRGEWVMNNDNMPLAEYEKLKDEFNPDAFDAAEWTELFKQSEARYITFTTKHHDGFCMFDSKLTEYKVTNSPLGRDVLSELVEASRSRGLRIFFYYSLLDWHHTDYFPLVMTGGNTGGKGNGRWGGYLDYYIGQVRELCRNYGEVGGFWFDGLWDKQNADWRLGELYETIHSLQPSALIGNNHHAVPFPGENFQIFEQDLPGSNTAGFNVAGVSSLPLETCLTMNNSWGYNATDNSYKSTEEIVQYILGANKLGANLLLNVGPLPNGKIHQEQQLRLSGIASRLRSRRLDSA